jgi:membrane protein required for beta-lactamase induction
MRLARFFKLILLIFECLTFSVAFNVIFRSINQTGVPGIALMASSALFPLMALFIWLDSTRYKVYMPLFIAGKCVGIFSIITGQVRNIDVISVDIAIVSTLFFSYILSIVVVILLIIREKNPGGGNQSEEKKLEVV